MADAPGQIPTLIVGDRLTSALAEDGRRALEEHVLPNFLPAQRWFGAKDSTILGVELLPLGDLEPGVHALAVAQVSLAAETQSYLLPLSAAWGEEALKRTTRLTPALARIRRDGASGSLIDGAVDPSFASALLSALLEDTRVPAEAGTLVFEGSDALRAAGDLGEPRALGAEQSNVSIAYGDTFILKLFRRMRAGAQPDVEVTRFLTQVGDFANTPQFMAEVRYEPADGEATTIAAGFRFVDNRGDAWTVVTDELTRDLQRLADSVAKTPEFSPSVMVGALLGQRTAGMHKALAAPTDDPAFTVEPLTPDEVEKWIGEATREANEVLDRVAAGLDKLPTSARSIAEDVLARRDTLTARIDAASAAAPSGGRSRIHGDYHLGQVLVTDGDFMIIDFEGEPRRSLAERRAKSSPLRDLAGMLRSFHYAAQTALNRQTDPSRAAALAAAWRERVSSDFLASYRAHVAGASSYPEDPRFAQALTDLFLIQKAIYEVAYELANRPDWIAIPLSGVRDLLNQKPAP